MPKKLNKETINYKNCVVTTIDNLIFNDNNSFTNNKLPTQEEAKKIREDMINYVAETLNFSKELVERVLETTEFYLKGLDNNNLESRNE